MEPKIIIKILIHLLPLVPLYFHFYYFTLAAILGVAIFYIKSMKLTKELEMSISKSAHPNAIGELRKLRDSWKAITFLK